MTGQNSGVDRVERSKDDELAKKPDEATINRIMYICETGTIVNAIKFNG